MPSKTRPQNVASLTGNRVAKESKLKTVLQKIERRCQAVARLVTASNQQDDATGAYNTRSKGPKKIYKLFVPDCADCNHRKIEAFEEEYANLVKLSPLLCLHKSVIQQVDQSNTEEEPVLPTIEVPALYQQSSSRRGTSGGLARLASMLTSSSSITVEKLESLKSELEKTFQELSDVHEKLGEAVFSAEEGEITGYDELYSQEAYSDFLAQYTDRVEDAIELLDEKCDQLRPAERLVDFRSEGSVSAFDDASSDTQRRINEYGNESRLDEFQGPIGTQPQELLLSNIASAGSVERLQREQDEFFQSQQPSSQTETLVGPGNVHTCVGTIPKSSTVVTTATNLQPPRTSSVTFAEFEPRSSSGIPIIVPHTSTIQTTAGGSFDISHFGTNSQSTLRQSDLSTMDTVLHRPATSVGVGQPSLGGAEAGTWVPPVGLQLRGPAGMNIVHIMERGKVAVKNFISSLDVDLRRISTGNVYRNVSRLRTRLQEGRKKTSDYEVAFRSYLPTVGLREQQDALVELSAHVVSFDSELIRLERCLDQVEDGLEPQVEAQRQPISAGPVLPPMPRVGRTFLERTKLPVFTGKVEEFPDFAKQFRELTQEEGYPEAILLSKLREGIPKEGKELLVGVEKMSVAWERLEKRYGDRKIAILTIQSRLVKVNLTGEKHERVEKLCGEVDRAVNLLRPLGALDALTRDFEMVGRLVDKLPEALQAEWDRHATSTEFSDDTSTDWEKFVEWLSRQRKIAHNAKIRWLEKQQSQNSTNKPTKLPYRGIEGCWKCGGKGHLSRSCTAPITGEVRVNYLEESESVSAVDSKFGKPKTKSDWLEILKQAKERSGSCPCCSKDHTYKRKFPWGELDWPSTQLKSCPKYTSMSPVQRGKKMEEVKGCSKCTSWKHQKGAKQCPRGAGLCTVDESGNKCNKDHDTSLHGSGSRYCSTAGIMTTSTGKKAKKQETEDEGCSPVLLEIQKVPLTVNGTTHETVMFFDNGSTATICTHKWAQKAGIKGTEVVYFLRVVGDQYTEKHTMLYSFTIEDNTGARHHLKAYGMDVITEVESVPDLRDVKHLFPGVPDEALRVPIGEVDLLIGQNHRSIQPKGAEEVKELRMVNSKFGCGKILTGTHPNIAGGGHCVNHAARLMKGMEKSLPNYATVFHNLIKIPSFFEAEELGTTPQPHCQSCTRKVSQCKDCSYRGQMLSQQQREVVRRVESSMHLDSAEQRIHVRYPLKPAAFQQRDNYGQAAAVQGNIEKRLIRDKLISDYDKEMMKAIEAKSVVKLSDEELDTWTGPVHYLTHFPVLKPGSVTTKVRIVANSKMKNAKTGLSLNDVVEAGPNALTPLLEVLILWRSVEVALMFDLSKAYQQLVTGEVERHLRRFLYRSSSKDPWQVYAYDRVTFGDVIAALCLELAKKLAAHRGVAIDPLASSRLIAGTYVDDHCGGGLPKEVARMRGNADQKGGKEGTMHEILKPCGFKTNFMVRSRNCSDEEVKALGSSVLGIDYKPKEDVLCFQITPTMVVQGKKRKKITTTLTTADVKLLKKGEMKLTRRMVLSFVMAQFDPLGLISPLLVHAKILLRRLYGQPELSWDDSLPMDEQVAWANYIEEAVKMPPILFKRSTKPEGAVGGPWLVGFHDGSLSAYAAAIYIVWTVEDTNSEPAEDQAGEPLPGGPNGGPFPGGPNGGPLPGGPNGGPFPGGPSGGPLPGGPNDGPFPGGPNGGPTKQTTKKKRTVRVSTLLLSKSRVSPIHGTTVPRAELQGLTVLSRLMVTVAKSLPDKPEKAILIGDSECSIAALEKTGGILGPYFGNRVAKIHENLAQLREHVDEVEPVWHIPGPLNPADLATRGHAHPADVGPGTVWQEGPDFLKEINRDTWPLSRTFRGDSVPQKELRSKHEVQNLTISPLKFKGSYGWSQIQSLVISVMERTNSWTKAQGILARLLRAKGSKVDENQRRQLIEITPQAQDLEAARHLQLLSSRDETIAAMKNGKLKSLMPEIKKGLVVTTGRFSEKQLTKLLGKESLPILMPNTRLAKLIFHHCHEEDHRLSATDTLARSRKFVWVPRGLKLAKSVVKSCMKCRLAANSTAKQIMSQVPEGVLEVSPPFTACALDLMGPYSVRGMGGGARKPMKVWGLLVVCLRMKAVAIFACAGYDTKSFMTAYSKFTSIYGGPALVISDQGSQLTSAAKQLGEKGIKWERVEALTARAGTKWTFTPRGCPWRNGMAERAVGMAKSTLAHQLDGNKSLDFDQLEALFLKVSYILNSRPIGARLLSEEIFHPITPNDLLLGRAARPREAYETQIPTEAVDPKEALTEEEKLGELWWSAWIKIAFPVLMPRGKWSTRHRNVCIGDIVLLRYEAKFLKDRYRLARVTNVHPDNSGVVRTVTVGIRPRDRREELLPYKAKPLVQFAVGIQRLVVILPMEEQIAPKSSVVEGDLPDQEIKESLEVKQPLSRGTEELKRSNHQRRSRRLQKLDPEEFLTASAQGKVPRPVLGAFEDIPTSLVCLFRGSPPLRVPCWMLDMMDGDHY